MYSARTAARVARIPAQRLRAWRRANLVHPGKFRHGKRVEDIYKYDDLLLIRLIVRLKEQGVKPKPIRVALDTIAHMNDGDRNAWKLVSMHVCDGLVVVIDPSNKAWNPIAASEGPQKMAVVFFPELIEELERELVPPDRFKHIGVDPRGARGGPDGEGNTSLHRRYCVCLGVWRQSQRGLSDPDRRTDTGSGRLRASILAGGVMLVADADVPGPVIAALKILRYPIATHVDIGAPVRPDTALMDSVLAP